MEVITVADIESNFSNVLDRVKNGEKFKILHDSIEKPVAIIIPIENVSTLRKIGILDGRARFTINGDGKISEEEFLSL